MEQVAEIDAELPVEVLLAFLIRSVVTKFSVGDILLSLKNVKEIGLVVPDHFDASQVGFCVSALTSRSGCWSRPQN
jgi:hypothetical protein